MAPKREFDKGQLKGIINVLKKFKEKRTEKEMIHHLKPVINKIDYFLN